MLVHISRCSAFLILSLLPFGLGGQEAYESETDLPSGIKPSLSPPRSPQDALQSFELVDGFNIELVASEPMIEDPVLIDWDILGRMWVCEMRGFMMDIDATDQFAKNGRISILEDTDGDGQMDKATRFLDDLVLPRAMRVFQEGLLVAEHDKLWFVADADGDLIPDGKELIDAEYATHGSVEHRPNGLLIGLDNWIYNSRSNKRYKRVDGAWVTEATENRGQWGITQDDYGRLFYNFHWSQLHADSAPPNTLTRNPNFKPTLSANATVSTDQFVYPIRMNTAINRGYRPGVLDAEGKLIRFASACSPWIYRGDAFPDHFKGDAFVCAPAANTIKRNLIVDKGLTVSGVNAYPDRDFLASTDERFRPVSLSGGPDGALYVVDMYRGIIQQADFMTPFLRRESERRKLEQPINLGRIYRIQSNSYDGNSLPDFNQLTPEQWVELLKHSNGWVRDKAQQWLVWERPETAIAALKALANGSDSLATIHALWALDGMDIDTLELSLNLITHSHDKIAIHARAIAARQAKSGADCKQLSAALSEIKTENIERTFHRVLALDEFDHQATHQPRLQIATQHHENPHIREALLSGLEKQELHFLDQLLHLEEWSQESSGKKLLIQELAAAALRRENSIEVGHLFQLALGSSWQAGAIREGLLIALLERDKPLQFPKDPGIKDPRFIAYLQWPGHQPSTRKEESVTALSSKEKALFAKGQTIYGSLCASCHGANGEGMTMLAPPLVNSEWVTGHPDRLARILLHGLEGSIDVNGKTYQSPKILPAMPPVGMMSNDELAATMTYIRRAWNHSASPVTSRDIQRNRDLTAAQTGAYQVSELIDFSDN